MDFKQIEVFISVAKHKSFSKAANAVFLSQPAVSSHISALEKELNIQLFDRTSKEVLLTPAGESFLQYAIEIINTRNKAIGCLESFGSSITGTLSLATSTTPCNTIVPILIKKFSEIYPSVTFRVTEQNSGDIVENIAKFNYEMGLVGSSVDDEKIKSYKLMEDELVLISSKSLRLPKEITLHSLTKYSFILREKSSATRTAFDNALKSKKMDLNELTICCEVNNLNALFEFVKLGIGVSIVSKNVYFKSEHYDRMNCSTIMDLPLKRNIYLIVSSRRTLTPTAMAFYDLCKKEYGF